MISRGLGGLLLLHVMCSIGISAGSLKTYTLSHDDTSRLYRLYIPEAYDGTQPWPLVFDLHGAGSNAFEQYTITGMSAVADEENLIVVYPEGTKNPAVQNLPFWNDFNTPDGVDDVGFLRHLLDDLLSEYEIDATRVYSTGFSQGGSMSYLLANQMPERIAAVAPISGPQPDNVTTVRPFPIMLMHGTADPIAPIAGGPINAPDLEFQLPAIDEVIHAWIQNNNCSASGTEIELDDIDPNDASTVTKETYSSCDSYTLQSGEKVATEVIYFRIENGGHAWPGSSVDISGITNRDINASREIWNFFSRHSLPHYIAGDFNFDGDLAADDLDMLVREARIIRPRNIFDVNSDNTIDSSDVAYWIKTLRNTWIGDANLDGEFNSGDLVEGLAAGTYEINIEAGWASGDFDGSGRFDSGDLVLALADGGYEQGPRASVAKVPEPNTLATLLIGSIAVSSLSRIRRRPV